MKIWLRSCWCWRDFSQRILRLKICSLVLLPALKPACSSAMTFSTSSSIFLVWSSAWLCLGGWWGWLFSSSGTAAGCLSWEVWWPRTGSTDWPFSCKPDLVADCHESSDYILSICLDQHCWDVVNSSWLLFLQWLYCSLHFFAKDLVVILCVCLGTVQYWWMSIGLVIVQFRPVFCPSVHYLSFFYEAIFWMILDSSIFPLFHCHQVFHELLCPLTIVLPQMIFFSLTTLFSYPVFFPPFFHAPLDVVVHFLIFRRSFKFKSFLSQFSPFGTEIKNSCSDPGFLLLMFAKTPTGYFSHCCVEGGDHYVVAWSGEESHVLQEVQQFAVKQIKKKTTAV